MLSTLEVGCKVLQPTSNLLQSFATSNTCLEQLFQLQLLLMLNETWCLPRELCQCTGHVSSAHAQKPSVTGPGSPRWDARILIIIAAAKHTCNDKHVARHWGSKTHKGNCWGSVTHKGYLAHLHHITY